MGYLKILKSSYQGYVWDKKYTKKFLISRA